MNEDLAKKLQSLNFEFSKHTEETITSEINNDKKRLRKKKGKHRSDNILRNEMENKLMQERLRDMVLSDIEKSSLSEDEKQKLFDELEACLEKHNQARILARRKNKENIDERILKRQLAENFENSEIENIEKLAENAKNNTIVLEESRKINEIEKDFIETINEVKEEYRLVQSELAIKLAEAKKNTDSEKYMAELMVKYSLNFNKSALIFS